MNAISFQFVNGTMGIVSSPLACFPIPPPQAILFKAEIKLLSLGKVFYILEMICQKKIAAKINIFF